MGDAICDGSTCYLSEYDYITGEQVNATPGTRFTLTHFEGMIFITNSTENALYCDNGVGYPFLLDVGSVHIIIIDIHNYGLTYTFSL
jgi:hypothetical protein